MACALTQRKQQDGDRDELYNCNIEKLCYSAQGNIRFRLPLEHPSAEVALHVRAQQAHVTAQLTKVFMDWKTVRNPVERFGSTEGNWDDFQSKSIKATEDQLSAEGDEAALETEVIDASIIPQLTLLGTLMTKEKLDEARYQVVVA